MTPPIRLPNLGRGFIAERKITHYLLDHEHRFGGAKAGFFTRFGFKADDWPLLRDALLDHARDNPVERR